MDAVDRAVVVSALEIAKFLLESQDSDDALDHLDISDEEADILLDRIKEMLAE
tara:strand:+ start:365 stop:523 length:159 start_codon:yes stop_codon:yes gene_type:complete